MQQERGIRRPDNSRRSANAKPSKTLFVINFDPVHTRTRDLEKHFEPHGRISNIRIRRNFAFIQFESEDEAAKALEETNMRLVFPFGQFSIIFFFSATFLSVFLSLLVFLNSNCCWVSNFGFSSFRVMEFTLQ